MIQHIRNIITIIFTNKKYWLLPLIIFAILFNMLFSDFGLMNNLALKSQKHDLLQSINRENMRTDSLKRRIEQLKYDSLEIEKIARVYYGMLKPGEKLYIYKDKTNEDKK